MYYLFNLINTLISISYLNNLNIVNLFVYKQIKI